MTAQPGAGGPMIIDLDGVDELPVQLGLSPYSTLVALTAGALGRWDLGGLPSQRRIIQDALAKPSGGALRLPGQRQDHLK